MDFLDDHWPYLIDVGELWDVRSYWYEFTTVLYNVDEGLLLATL